MIVAPASLFVRSRARTALCFTPSRFAGPLIFAIVFGACLPSPSRTRADISKELTLHLGMGVGEKARSKSQIPKGVQLQDGLTESETIALALWNNADLQSTLAQLGFAKADLYQAGQLPNPTFSIFLPLGPKQLEMTLGVALDWLWTRPYRVASAQLDLRATAKVLVAQGLDRARDARIAHAELDVARRRLILLRRTEEIWARIAKLARARLMAGAASRLELTAAESDARIAKLEAQQQQQTVHIMDARFKELINLPQNQGTPKKIEVISEGFPDLIPSLEQLLKRAISARPEIRAAELRIEATGERAGLERARIFDLIAFADSNGPGFRAFEAGPGFQLSLPVLNQNQAGRARVKAQLESVTWGYIATKQRIDREVRESYHRMRRAQEALSAWPKEVVAPLSENVGRAERAYVAGGVTYLQVLDATRRLTEAQLRELQLEVEAKLSLAQLYRSVGGKLDA